MSLLGRAKRLLTGAGDAAGGHESVVDETHESSNDEAESETESSPPPAPERPKPKGLWMAKESPWAYVVVPKAACTTAGQYLYYGDHGYYYFDDIHALRYGILKAGVDERALGERIDAVGDDLFTFTFVRNPYARLVSGFLDKVMDLDQGYRPDIRDRLCSDWGVRLRGEQTQVENFRQFVRFVDYQYAEWDQVKDGAEDRRANWQKVDIHWLRQSWFLRRGRRGAGRIDFIGTVETMAQDLEEITGIVGPRHVPAMADMPKFGVGPKREFPLEDYFDDDTKEIVDRVFEADFRLLGYATDISATRAAAQSGLERAQGFEARFEAHAAASAAADATDDPNES